MVMIREAYGDLIEPGLRTIFFRQFRELESMLPILFNMGTSSKPYEKDSSIGALGDFGVLRGKVDYDQGTQGYDKQYDWVEYAKGIEIGRTLIDDDLYKKIEKQPLMLGDAAAIRREEDGASIFNEAFTDTTISGDSKELCADDHSSTADTSYSEDNEGITALSATAVEAVRIIGRKTKNDRGKKANVRFDTIIIPRDQEETAWEIINSKGKIDTADNNRNFHQGKYKLVVWDELTDTNNWFMADSKLMKMFLLWFDRIPLEFNQDRDSDTYKAKFSAYMRYGFGYSGWRWIYGMLVS